MLIFEPFEKNYKEEIIAKIHRNQLPYFEYKELETILLKENFDRYLNEIDGLNKRGFIARENDNIIGFLGYSKNVFDSQMFSFDCFTVDNVILFHENNIKEVLGEFINELEFSILKKSEKAHIFYSLNNNYLFSNQILNAFTNKGYHYIHTLLTFGLSKKNAFAKEELQQRNDVLRIRNVKTEDVKTIENLAEKSFKYSRFHMDPFLPDEQSNLLLKTSARNSILEGFVDVMYVAEYNNKVVGYYSAKKQYNDRLKVTIGTAVISAVDVTIRGAGVFNDMDSRLLIWFSENTDYAEMGTYLINYPIHKTWINKKLPLIRGNHQVSKFIKRENETINPVN